MTGLRALLAAAACLLGCAAAAVAAPDADVGVAQLRAAGDYGEALEAARRERAALTGADPAAREAAADAGRLVATLTDILALPPPGRRAMTEADSLRLAVLHGFRERAWQRCLADLARELVLRRRWQGPLHEDVGRALYVQGRILAATGDRNGALAALAAAAEVQRHTLGPGHAATILTLRHLADQHQQREDYAAARGRLEEAVAASATRYGRDHERTLAALDYLATVTDRAGDERRAAALREECVARTRQREGPDSPRTAAALRRLALSYQKLGRLHEAEAGFEESLAILRRAGADTTEGYAAALTGLGVVLQRQGRLDRAEACHLEALTCARRVHGDDDVRLARYLNNLALLAELQGRHARAADDYRQALALQRAHLPPSSVELALTLDNLASLERARGRPAAALPLYEEALAIRRGTLGERHADVARSYNHVGQALLDLERADEAEPALRTSLAVRREVYGDDHPMIAVAVAGLARLARIRGQWDRADSLGRAGLAMRRAWLGDRHPDVGRDLVDLARVRHEQGRLDEAADLLAEAAAVHEQARLRTGEGLIRATADLADPYPLQALVALARHDAETAWAAVEHARARALADLVAAARRRALGPEASARADSLRRRVLDCEQRLLAVDGVDAGAGDLRRRLRRELEVAEAARAALRRDHAADRPLAGARLLDADAVAARLGPRETLIGWLDAAGRGGAAERWCYVVHPVTGLRWLRLEVPADGTDAADLLRRRLRDPTTAPDSLDAAARRVWRERLAAASPLLVGTRRLVVVPGGPMLGLPVETLRDASDTLVGDRFVVSYAPSATVLAMLRERADGRPPGPPTRALLVGDPPSGQEHLPRAPAAAAGPRSGPAPAPRETTEAVAPDPRDLPRLVGSRQEVAAIAALVPAADVLLGPEATERALVERVRSRDLARRDLLHFATHALVDDERPTRSALVLAQTDVAPPAERVHERGRIYDGLLTAGEIASEWELRARLVVLSACETGLGRRVAGEGYIGFTHAFLQAGAGAVVVSLWPVDDRSTALLMTRFYENLLGVAGADRGAGPGIPLDAAAALAEAKDHLRGTRHRGRRAYAHPFHWSPFILVGGS